MNISLEQKVEDRTAELSEANERLRDLDLAKTNFFANVSHELRTPLTLILSPLESILQGQYRNMPDHKFFESLYAHGARLLRLINNLLDFSKIEAGRMTMVRTPANVDDLLPLYVSTIRSGAESRGLVVSYENRAGHVRASLDRDLFENALYNLLSNAIKFTPGGGRIKVALDADKENALISVCDTGIGIPAENHEIIFERFSQGDASSTRRYEGTGIGLSLTREIARMHGGDVSVLSVEGEGATFTLAIPLVSDATADLREDVAQETPVDSFKWEKIAEDASSRVNTGADDASSMEKEFRVLLVDDNDDMLSFLREIFSADYEIVTGRNGREAMDILIGTDDLPDIIVSDVMMPEMDGFELAESVRTDRRFEGIPILLLTARTDVPDRLTGFRRGATDYIAKPFNARELLARANAQIHLKILRDRLARTNERLYEKLKAATGEEAQPVSDASREKVAKVIEFIKENYDADLSREGLAAAVGLSPDHFSRIFNQVTGLKIAEYVNGLRVAEAEKRLVESDATVTEIAYAVGFDTVKTFNRAFRKITGITPSEYRVRN